MHYGSQIEGTERQRNQFRLVFVEYKESRLERLDCDRSHDRMRLNRLRSLSGPVGTCVSLDAAKTFRFDLKHSDGE